MLKKLLERQVQNAAPCNVLPAANAPSAPPYPAVTMHIMAKQ